MFSYSFSTFNGFAFVFISKHIVSLGRIIHYAYIMLITFDIIIITAFRCVNLVQIKNGSVIINGIENCKMVA